MPVLFIVAIIMLAVVFGPLALIWALNTLFPVVAIPYTFWTWLAMLCVGGIFSTGRGK